MTDARRAVRRQLTDEQRQTVQDLAGRKQLDPFELGQLDAWALDLLNPDDEELIERARS